MSNFKKCLADANLQVPLEEIKIDEKLHFLEEPVDIMDRKVKKLKQRRIQLVKVRLNSKRGAEYTWEREDQFKSKISKHVSCNKEDDRTRKDSSVVLLVGIIVNGIRSWLELFGYFVLLVDLLSHRLLKRNKIQDAENESRIKTLATDHANEGHAFRPEPSEPEETTTKEKEEIQEQSNKQEETTKYDRNSSPHSGTRAKNIPSHRAKSSEKEEHSSRYKEGGERRGGKMAQGWNSKASMIPLVGG
ncbi:hypothetical protein Tco_1160882 [Tanacetum coccineum]